MKSTVVRTSIVFIQLVLSLSAAAQSKLDLRFVNKLPIVRADDPVSLSRTSLERKGLKIPEGAYLHVTDASGQAQPIQFDDLNNDGQWDELAMLLNFQPNEQKVLTFQLAEAPPPLRASRAHVRHMRKQANNSFGPDLRVDSVPPGQPATDFAVTKLPPFLTEGPAWENDKVGFRLYFDVRNGKDIWGKTTPEMVMDQVGKNTKTSYHDRADWGMDVLKVGKSLGAGALALLVPFNGKDTLVRLGGGNMGKILYEKITDGPVRALFKLTYPEWRVLPGVQSVRLTELVSIWGGQYYTESRVIVSNAPKDARVVTGVVNLKSQTKIDLEVKGVKGIYTFDKQSENNDLLGMAVLIPVGQKGQSGQTPNAGTDITQTYYMASPVGKEPFVFRFYAGWEQSAPSFKSIASFGAFLNEQARRWASPVMGK
jgi:hypothetical protein